MGSTTKTAKDKVNGRTEADKPKVERKRLTPAERIARAEQELAAAKAKAEAEVKVKADKLVEKRTALVAQIKERQDKVAAIDAELRELGVETDAPVTEGSVEAPAEDSAA
jgi:hypothetical protein